MRSRAVFLTACLLLMPAVLSAQGDEGAELLIGLARVKRDAGDLQAAIRYFDAAQRVRPLATTELAEYFWCLADVDGARAREVADRILLVHPGSGDIRERAIALALVADDEVAVRRLAAAGEEAAPGASLWPRRLGESFLREGRAADAAAVLARAVRAPDAADADWASYAVALEAAGRASEALEAWSHVRLAAWNGRGDWSASRLRALAAAAPADVASAAIEDWLQGRPEDEEMRGLLVEAWARAGQPARALEAMGALTTGPGRQHWLRREGELAQLAGNRSRAIRAFEQWVRAGGADADTLWMLAELMVEAEMYARAVPVIQKAGSGPNACDERMLRLFDRFPEPSATDHLLTAVERRSARCPADSNWAEHVATRAVALGRHAEALAVIERVAAGGDASMAARSLQGRLLLWTGHPARAADVLEAVVAVRPSPEDVDALIDAYRATGRLGLAWSLASPRLEDETVSVERRLELAGLAIEADQPERALDTARALGHREPQAALVAGRALLELGRPGEALEILGPSDAALRSPEAALALADATAVMLGPRRALGVARDVEARGAPWVEVEARRALWEARAGDRGSARSIRDRVAMIDQTRAVLLDAEIALADERPDVAIEALRDLVENDAEARALDLYSVALSGTGDHDEALRVLAGLRARRPRFVPFALREVEWRWRAAPTAAALARVLEVAAVHAARADAQAMAARVLFEDGRYEKALGVLGSDQATWQRQPVEGQLLAARALRALGRHAEALGIVAQVPTDGSDVALLRAELTSTVHGIDAADPLFETMAASGQGGPGMYLAWSSVQPTPRARQQVLVRGVERFPGNVDLLVAQARAAGAARDWPAALQAAGRAIALDARRSDAWTVRIDAIARIEPADLEDTLDRCAEIFNADPAVMIGMAERIAMLARSASDPLVTRALRWLDSLPEVDRRAEPAALARARILAASERWIDALAAVDGVLGLHPGSLQARRLKADLLAFSGRYDEAMAAYDAYLVDAPLDLEAARLRARVAGWAGDVDAARARYEALIDERPETTVIAAEAAAKAAFYEARWRDAVPAYERWLALEPDSREAAFELAQSQAAVGNLSAADRLLRDLDTNVPVHRFARAASDRLALARRPSGGVYTSHQTSDGYGGLRLLEVSEQGGMLASRLGASLPLEVGVSGGAITAGASNASRQGYRAAAFGSYRLSPSWKVEARAGLLDFNTGGDALIEGAASIAWSPADRWRLVAGAERTPVLENLVTVDGGLVGTGGTAGVAFESVTTDIRVAGSRRALSDGNGLTSATVTATRSLVRGRSEVRLVGWAWYVTYDEGRADYFSPDSFVRADAGVEWSWWFQRPRFRGDRERRLTAGYLIGTDSDGVVYHRPRASLVFELPAGISLAAGADWLRSDVYRETRAYVGVRLGPAPRGNWGQAPFFQ